MRVAIDFEAEGLLDGTDDREARIELLRTLESEGFTLEELREAAAHNRLALLPVERVLAGDGQLYTKEELAEKTGLDTEFLNEAARALGVPVRQPGERAITEEELELSHSAKALLDAGLPPEAFLELTAVMSRAMANVAASFTSVFGEALLHPGDTERDLGLRYAETLRNLGPLAAPTLEQMFNLRMREQMREAVISQAELQSGRLAGSQPITVGFVDIVGFTQLGEDVEPEELGPVVRGFERTVAEAVDPPVKLVKTIGDAAMLVSPEPGPVVATVIGLVDRSHDEGPLLRGGVASGDGLPRAGDWYGRPVNLAARLTGFAKRGSVVTSKEVHETCADAYDWSDAGRRRFKGVKGSVEVFRVRRLQDPAR
ncbi:MAG TPA: adenylate cyclase regulatory domain-containing protein [Thermoleophilaceae bacterium]|nr:adenylate cyclase regulatory domain-containing protein [Thermoleophilaceae bacterium]